MEQIQVCLILDKNKGKIYIKKHVHCVIGFCYGDRPCSLRVTKLDRRTLDSLKVRLLCKVRDKAEETADSQNTADKYNGIYIRC